MWKHWVCVILGFWIIIMPYVLQSWNLHQAVMVVTGIIIAVLSFWSLSESKRHGSV